MILSDVYKINKIGPHHWQEDFSLFMFGENNESGFLYIWNVFIVPVIT